MRTTRGKPTLDRSLEGEPALAAAMAAALQALEQADRVTHGFHTYPAGLNPDAARDLLSLFPGDSLHDPFCGGGTVLVEGLLAGRRVHGRDLSPIAQLVARARTRVASPEDLTQLRATARRLADVAKVARAMPPGPILSVVGDWYEPHVLAELEALRVGVRDAQVSEEARWLLWATFSSIVVKASFRASDTSGRREVHARPPETTAILFHKKSRELGRRLEALAAAVPPGALVADVGWGDARQAPDIAPVDLILTSPPYPSVYDYLAVQDLRAAWMDVELAERREIGPRRAFQELGSREAWRQWQADTHTWTRAVSSRLRPGGHLVVVIGDGLVEEGTVPTWETTRAAAEAAGLRFRASASLARPDPVRRATRWEHALAFTRP